MDNALFEGALVRSRRILYTPSPFARGNLLHLQETGTLQARKPHTRRRSDLASYLFFMVKEGSGTLEYQDIAYPLQAGDCVFLDCRREHFHESSPDLWTLKWVHFDGPQMDAIYQKYLERGGAPSFHPCDPGRFEKVLDELFFIAGSNSYVRDMQLCEKITALLTLLMEEAWDPQRGLQASQKRLDLQKIRAYLDQNYSQRITLDQLSEQFYINKFYLSKIFSKQYGMTIQQYLIQLRITQAKQLLRFSDLPIEKIAAQCGIPDPNYFSRLFRKVEGIAPGEFRRRW